jgi:hypothetical protein
MSLGAVPRQAPVRVELRALPKDPARRLAALGLSAPDRRIAPFLSPAALAACSALLLALLDDEQGRQTLTVDPVASAAGVVTASLRASGDTTSNGWQMPRSTPAEHRRSDGLDVPAAWGAHFVREHFEATCLTASPHLKRRLMAVVEAADLLARALDDAGGFRRTGPIRDWINATELRKRWTRFEGALLEAGGLPVLIVIDAAHRSVHAVDSSRLNRPPLVSVAAPATPFTLRKTSRAPGDY